MKCVDIAKQQINAAAGSINSASSMYNTVYYTIKRNFCTGNQLNITAQNSHGYTKTCAYSSERIHTLLGQQTVKTLMEA